MGGVGRCKGCDAVNSLFLIFGGIGEVRVQAVLILYPIYRGEMTYLDIRWG